MSRSRWRGLSAGLGVLAGIVLLAGSTAPVSHASPGRQPLALQSPVDAGRAVPEDPLPPPPVPPPPPAPPLPAGAIGRLVISAIGVNAAIVPVGATPQGGVGVTKGIWDVGWFDQSMRPSSPGSALIEGHLDWYTGPAVFWSLRRVQVGDEIDYVHLDGSTSRFLVTLLRQLPYSGGIPGDMLGADGPSRLNLVTCSGTWLTSAHTYSHRLVVTATLIS